MKKTNGTEPPDLGCYGFLNQHWARHGNDSDMRGVNGVTVGIARSDTRGCHAGRFAVRREAGEAERHAALDAAHMSRMS